MESTSLRDHSASGLAWRESGAGEVAIFLHGLGGSRTAWDPQLRALHDVRRCVAWDMPGYGESPALADMTFEAVADAVRDLADIVDAQRVDLVGLSFGGMHALHAALRHPDRIRSLVLADTSAAFGANGTDADAWIAQRTARLDAGQTPADIGPDVLRAITAPGFGGPALADATAAFGRIPSDGLRAACRCLVTHNVVERLATITTPTMVVVGELDEETPLPYSQVLVDGIAGASLHVVAGVGHLTPSEAPEAFNALVRNFWNTVGSHA